MCFIARALLVAMVAVAMTAEVDGTWRRFLWLLRPRINCKSQLTEDSMRPDVSAPMSDIRALGIDGCTADIGTCPTNAECRFDDSLDESCDKDGYVCPALESRSVTCDIGPFLANAEVTAVARCVCCKDVGLTITGRVIDIETRAPISCIKVFINKKTKVYSDRNGRFKATIKSKSETEIIFKASDQMNEYMETVKIEDIPMGFRGPLDVTIEMYHIAPPIEFESSIGTTLTVDGNSGDPIALIEIPPDAFSDYDGIIKASLTIIDSTNVDTVTPGRFLTTDGKEIITYKIFSLNYETSSGDTPQAPEVIISLTDDWLLWDLANDGRWSPKSVTPIIKRRKKRQSSAFTTTFLTKLANGKPVNIDKLPTDPLCYIKIRVFEKDADNNEIEVITSENAEFKPSVSVLFGNQTLNLYFHFTSSPASTCLKVRCRSGPNAAQGLISLTSFEEILFGDVGLRLPYTNTLTPRQLGDYTVTILAAHSANAYAVIEGNRVFTNFISTANGPFYTDLATCDDSTIEDPAFHFIKNPLPVYSTSDEGIELCTARLGFMGDPNFNALLGDIVDNGFGLPNILALNTWPVENGNITFTVTNASMELSNSGDPFVFACLSYRCSEADQLTSVFVDIQAPNITSGQGDQFPAFICFGGCGDEVLKRGTESACLPGFEARFEAPVNVTDRADSFPEDENECRSNTNSEDFAFMFYCFSNQQFGKP